MPPVRPRIALIAGAGPAGLTAAYELLRRTDIHPVVVEATNAIGGIAQTFEYKGNRIDIGGHRFFSKSERVMAWWMNILPPQGKPAADTATAGHEIDYATTVTQEPLCAANGAGGTRSAPDPERDDEVMLQRPRLSRIFYRGHFFPYPLSITLSVAWRLGLVNTVLIALSYLTAQLLPRRDETYLDAFFINRFGKRLYETFFRGYTQKVWGVPCEQIRADWGAQRVKGLSLVRAVSHAIKDLLSSDFQKRQQQRETSLITRFWYPKFGPGQMWETVAGQVVACGGELHLQTRVVALHCAGETVTSATVADAQGNRRDIACDFFVSTMPVRDLARMMLPAPPVDAARIADGLQYRDFLTVGLLLKELHVQEAGKPPATRVPDNWIYVQDSFVDVGRIQVFNNWSPYLVADRERTVWIGLEYFVSEGDRLWAMADDALVAHAVREMEAIGFARAADVLDGCVLRMPKAYPAYFGTYPELPVVQRWINSIPNLFLVGRNGMHRYNNQDHSMLTAMLAVDNIVAGRTDDTNLWDVNLEEEYHEEHAPKAADAP